MYLKLGKQFGLGHRIDGTEDEHKRFLYGWVGGMPQSSFVFFRQCGAACDTFSFVDVEVALSIGSSRTLRAYCI